MFDVINQEKNQYLKVIVPYSRLKIGQAKKLGTISVTPFKCSVTLTP